MWSSPVHDTFGVHNDVGMAARHVRDKKGQRSRREVMSLPENPTKLQNGLRAECTP